MVDDSETRGTRAAAGDPTFDGRDATSYTKAPTVDSEALTGAATIVPRWDIGTYVALPDPGYQLGELIGRGGMGEVVVAQDQRIGREVAVKRIRAKSPSHDLVQRFLREARIQARLDHPAIVPVYELGTDEEGLPYFTMKRLTGVTLGKRLAERAPIQPLLRAFCEVCLAIEFAHKRGVIHRDLKPSNIMLGDYGEVYVLDWGVARVLADRSRATNPMAAVEEPEDDRTTVGAILGTPGYMAPEQIRGEDAGRASDVYALGSILFEILAGEPLHPRGEAALATTLTNPQVAPAVRAAERPIAPELDLACFDALAEKPTDRPTARQLAERVQAYLDGDRDHERRRTLAAEQLAAAREALDSAADDGRAIAMRRAGRALALDPGSDDAAALVTRLMVEPPEKLPPDLVKSLEDEERASTRDRSKKALWSYGFVLAFLPLALLLDTKNRMLQVAFWGLITLLCVVSYRTYRTGRQRIAVSLIVNLAALIVFSRVASPFMLTPAATVGVLMSFASSPRLLARPWLVASWVIVAVMLPIGLEVAGLIPRTFEVTEGVIRTTSEFYAVHGRLDEIALVAANLGFIAIAAVFAFGVNRHRAHAGRQLHVQAWHLRQLLPAKGSWRTKS